MVKLLEPEDGYDRYSSTYSQDHRKLDSFDRQLFLAQLPEGKVDWTLDLGAGDGRLGDALLKCSRQVVGIDIAARMLRMLNRRIPLMSAVRADASYGLPIRSESIDLVTAAFFFVHIHDPDPVLEEVYRILRPNGRFVFNLIPQRREPELKTGRDRFKIRSYYHSPPAVEKRLDYHWFNWRAEPVTEGRVWVSRVYCCDKT